MRKHRIVITGTVRNWVIGTIDGLKFEAKVYDLGSEYGIDDGRVSKLAVYYRNSKLKILAYDRGWYKHPSKRYVFILDALMDYLEDLPPVDYWQLHNGRIVRTRKGETK